MRWTGPFLITSIAAPLLALIISACTPEPPEPALDLLTPEQLYFLEIVFGSESGDDFEYVRKWETNMRIFIPDTTYAYMNEELDRIINELNGLITGITISTVKFEIEANYILFLGSADKYVKNYEPNALTSVENNWGLFWLYWMDWSIYRGTMYVDMIRTRELACKKHLLREELTQSLGPMDDSYLYYDSMFQQDWTCITEFSDFDRYIIELLYSPDIRAGMSRQEVVAFLLTSS